MGMTEDKVRQLVMQGREAGSLDAPAVGGDDPSALVDLVAAPEAEMAGDACQLVEDVQAAVDRLPPEDAELLRQRMAGRPLWKIGEQRGVSRERVRQLETRARQRLAAVPGLRELLAG
jgi:RNA polymerase sigma factor (sigma-70 family)